MPAIGLGGFAPLYILTASSALVCPSTAQRSSNRYPVTASEEPELRASYRGILATAVAGQAAVVVGYLSADAIDER
jgi:hypothetical protein